MEPTSASGSRSQEAGVLLDRSSVRAPEGVETQDCIHVLLVEPDPEFLREHAATISRAPDLCLVGSGSDLVEGLSSGFQVSPIDVLVIDVSQPGMHRVESWTVIHALLPGVAVVAMLQALDDAGLVTAVAAGALGLYRHDAPRTDLVRCIRHVARHVADHDAYLAGRLRQALSLGDTWTHGSSTEGIHPARRHDREVSFTSVGDLTRRELEILQMLGRGLSNRVIASKLFVSERTVRNCVSRLLAKLGLTNRTQAALWVRGYWQEQDMQARR